MHAYGLTSVHSVRVGILLSPEVGCQCKKNGKWSAGAKRTNRPGFWPERKTGIPAANSRKGPGSEVLAFPITRDSGDDGDSRGPQIGPFLPGWGGIPAIAAAPRATPPPSRSTRISKGLDGCIPRSSQIGADFSDLDSIGIGFSLSFASLRALCG